MDLKEEFPKLVELINNYHSIIKKYVEGHYNSLYKSKLEEKVNLINHTNTFIKAGIDKSNNKNLIDKFNSVYEKIVQLIDDNTTYPNKLEIIKELNHIWPDIEIEFENFSIKSFDIPNEIPMTESRLDLEEAIKDYDAGCYISSLVLCRRAYEGSLVNLYKSIEGKDPIETRKCNNCNTVLYKDAYFGIVKLHKWAIEKNFVTEKLDKVGFLLSDIGAGSAHPPLKDFPRDKDLAKLGIDATIMLLKEIYKNNSS